MAHAHTLCVGGAISVMMVSPWQMYCDRTSPAVARRASAAEWKGRHHFAERATCTCRGWSSAALQNLEEGTVVT